MDVIIERGMGRTDRWFGKDNLGIRICATVSILEFLLSTLLVSHIGTVDIDGSINLFIGTLDGQIGGLVSLPSGICGGASVFTGMTGHDILNN